MDQSEAPVSRLSRVREIAELVKRLCLALTNVEMFSADHPLARKGIASAYDWLAELLRNRGEAVVISVSAKQIVLDGLPLEDRNPLVGKLAARLTDFHVNNLSFEPAITPDELQELFRVFGRGPKHVDEHGGVAALLTGAGVQHVRSRAISYRMVTEEERVVGRDARVESGAGTNADMVRYMVEKVLERAEDQQWLMTEIKNNPQQMAGRIAEGIELAISRAEAGLAGEEDSIAALLQNVRMVAGSLLDETTGEVKDGQGDLEKALLNLEQEIRVRSSRLMSSKVASGFVNEILALVTSYSDRVRAKQISDEFLRGERSLKRAEQLLKEMAPKHENVSAFLVRVREHLVKCGMSGPEAASLLDRTKQREERRSSRPERKPYAQAVREGVAKRLKDLPLDAGKMEEVTGSLSAFIEERAREKVSAIRAETQALRASQVRRTEALNSIALGVVIWNETGETEFTNAGAVESLGMPNAPRLSQPLKELLISRTFPCRETPGDPDLARLSADERKLLLAVFRTVRGADGALTGVILSPAASG